MRATLVLVCVFLFTAILLTPVHASVIGKQILSPSSNGWEASIIWRPVVVNTGSSFMMWYSGENSQGIDNIGLATSSDGISWTRYSQNPVLAIGASGQWDSGSVNEAWIMQQGGQFKMWYTGQTLSASTGNILSSAIGYATSSDGIHWTKYSGNPLIPSYVSRPIVLFAGSTYSMYYEGENGQIELATSTDGLHWTQEESVVSIPSGSWDSYANDLTGVTLTAGGYLMAYEGWSSKPATNAPILTNFQIGFAWSADGISSTPYSGNPVITAESGSSSWDGSGVGYPTVLSVGSNYYVYYTGLSGTTYSIGMAILPSSNYAVPEFSSNQLLVVATVLASAIILSTRYDRKSSLRS